MAQRFTNLRCHPAGSADAHGGFVLVCTARAPRHNADLRFTVGFQSERLMLRSLTVETAEPLGVRRSALNLSTDDLLGKVREWIITDGEPGPDAQQTRDSLGIPTPPEYGWWADKLAEFRDVVSQPETRSTVRTPDYLRRLATEYVRLGIEGVRAPIEVLRKVPEFAKSHDGIDKDLGIARKADWLAPTRRGVRGDKPGAALLRFWAEHGHPEWYPAADERETPSDRDTKGDN